MGYAMNAVRRMSLIDDKIVFALFLAVCPPEVKPFRSNRRYRTGICRCYFSSGYYLVSGVTGSLTHDIDPQVAVPFGPGYTQRVSNIAN